MHRLDRLKVSERLVMAENKGAILVMNRKDECVKWFKTWHAGNPDKAKVEIRFKNKDGEKKMFIKEYSCGIMHQSNL